MISWWDAGGRLYALKRVRMTVRCVIFCRKEARYALYLQFREAGTGGQD